MNIIQASALFREQQSEDLRQVRSRSPVPGVENSNCDTTSKSAVEDK